MTSRTLSLLTFVLLVITACGSDAAPEALPLTDTGDAVAVSTTVTQSAPTTAAPESTTAAPTTSVAPTTTAAPVVSQPVEVLDVCESERVSVVVPDGWFDRECEEFSPAPFPAPGEADGREWVSEMYVGFVANRTYSQVVEWNDITETVLASEQLTVDGLSATRLTLRHVWWDDGEITRVIVDAGDGVVEITAYMFADSNVTDGSIDDRYAITLAALDEMLATIEIDEGVVPTGGSASVSYTPIGCATGEFSVLVSAGDASGAVVDAVYIDLPGDNDVYRPASEDGTYEIPQWTGNNDVTAHASISSAYGSQTVTFANPCIGLFNNTSYQICSDDSVAIAYPNELDSNVDLGLSPADTCAFFRYGPAENDPAVVVTEHIGQSSLDVEAAVLVGGGWIDDQPEAQGGPDTAFNLFADTDQTDLIGRAWIVSAPDGTFWSMVTTDPLGLVVIDDMQQHVAFAAPE